ncbi:MAG: hypothetical protein JXB00_17610 [Bacteroidales bacterium]|nr:hypothetical protein [Bacteroidales bacterium]
MTPYIKTLIFFFLIITAVISCDNFDISSKQSDTFIKFYGATNLDYGSDVKQLPNGKYFVTGTVSLSESNASAFTLVTDEYGNSTTDLKTIAGESNTSSRIAMTALLPDGGIIAIGTYQVRSGNNDIWVLRFNSQGDTTWTRKFGSSNNDEGMGLVINENNEIVCIGYTTVVVGTNIPDKQIWMHKLSLEGSELWPKERIHGATDDDEKIAIDDIGNYIISENDGYIVVCTISEFSAGRNDKNINVIKFDINGLHPLIIRQIKLSNDEESKIIKAIPESNGYFVLANSTSITDGSSDILLMKLNNNLDTTYTRIIDNGESETASALVYKNNRIYILGTSYNTRNDTRRMLLISTSDNGENPVYNYYGFTKERIEGFGMGETADGGFILTGSNILLYKMLNPGDF